MKLNNVKLCYLYRLIYLFIRCIDEHTDFFYILIKIFRDFSDLFGCDFTFAFCEYKTDVIGFVLINYIYIFLTANTAYFNFHISNYQQLFLYPFHA